jgi:LL-diaminopimelate aminotransferase
VPKDLQRGGVSLRDLWARRQSTKFNGVSYITQKGAEATLTAVGRAQVRETIDYYLHNAQTIRKGLEEMGLRVWGAVNSPYVWLQAPQNMGSWDLFDFLLTRAQVVGTPGSGFGPAGEGYFRLTGFGDAARTAEAVARIKAHFAL